MSASLALVAGMTAALYTVAPTGWYKLCVEAPTQCQPVAGAMPTVGQADAINHQINDTMRPEPEIGRSDVWKVGGKTGDCEDYALAKRDLLIHAGIGSAYARIAVGDTAAGERHAVLIVTTANGDYVLDNLVPRLIPLDRSTFKITALQSPDDPHVWIRYVR